MSTVGLVELYSGFNQQERVIADAVVDGWLYHEITPPIAKEAGRIRYEYLRQGTTLSVPDTLTAAVAIAHDSTLVTNNVPQLPEKVIRLPRHDKFKIDNSPRPDSRGQLIITAKHPHLRGHGHD